MTTIPFLRSYKGQRKVVHKPRCKNCELVKHLAIHVTNTAKPSNTIHTFYFLTPHHKTKQSNKTQTIRTQLMFNAQHGAGF